MTNTNFLKVAQDASPKKFDDEIKCETVNDRTIVIKKNDKYNKEPKVILNGKLWDWEKKTWKKNGVKHVINL